MKPFYLGFGTGRCFYDPRNKNIIETLEDVAKDNHDAVSDYNFLIVVEHYNANEDDIMDMMVRSKQPIFTRTRNGWDVSNYSDL